MSVRVTKLERTPEGYWTANLTVDGITYSVQKEHGSWQTAPVDGITHDVLPWAAAELQDRLTLVQASQVTDEEEKERMTTLRYAVKHAKRLLTRPERKKVRQTHYDEPELAPAPTAVTNIDTKRIARRMAAAGRAAIKDDGDAA